MNDTIDIKMIRHGSAVYEQEVQLRSAILREPLGLKFEQEELTREMQDKHIGAFGGNRLIGCLVLTRVSKDIMRMRQFAVHKKWRKRGVGKQLIRYAEKLSLEQGYHTMILHAREHVITYYQRLDYRITGEPFYEVGILHCAMEKQL